MLFRSAVYFVALKYDNQIGTGSGNCGDGASNSSTHVVWSVVDELLSAVHGGILLANKHTVWIYVFLFLGFWIPVFSMIYLPIFVKNKLGRGVPK